MYALAGTARIIDKGCRDASCINEALNITPEIFAKINRNENQKYIVLTKLGIGLQNKINSHFNRKS